MTLIYIYIYVIDLIVKHISTLMWQSNFATKYGLYGTTQRLPKIWPHTFTILPSLCRLYIG